LFPTLPTLLRIAMLFGVSLDYFFSDESKRPVERIVLGRSNSSWPRPLVVPELLSTLH
jgi:hypothetical protein